MLPDGREAMYDLVDTGTLAAANDLLNNVWDVPRYQPVTLPTPLTWTEDPYHQHVLAVPVLQPAADVEPAVGVLHDQADRSTSTSCCEILTSFTAYDATNPERDRTRLDYPHGAAFRAMILVDDYVKLQASGVLPAGAGRRDADQHRQARRLPVDARPTTTAPTTTASARSRRCC